MSKNKDVKILKYFTFSSTLAIREALADCNVDDLINGAYLHSNDKDIEYMIREYEKMLILSKLNFEKFQVELHDFYLRMLDWIKSNKMYKKFFKLVNMVYIELEKKNVPVPVLTGVQDILVQQYAYFYGTSRSLVYGVESNDKLLLTPEVGSNLTDINYELNAFRSQSGESFTKTFENTFAKYGYKGIDNFEDAYRIISYDQLNTNMIYQLAYYIDETNKSLLPKPYRNPNLLLHTNFVFMNCNKENIKTIENALVHRSSLLPTEGVICKFSNMRDIIEIYYTEKIVDDNVIILFKIKFIDGTYTLGFYDTGNQVYYDYWMNSSHEEITSEILKHIVLQNYMYLTCELTEEELKNLYWFKEVNKEVNLKNILSNIPMVYYAMEEVNNKGVKTGRTRNFDRSNYIAQLKDIKPFLRKLPMDASPSQDATDLAKKLGIDLPSGYTFVHGFTKKVYKTNGDNKNVI